MLICLHYGYRGKLFTCTFICHLQSLIFLLCGRDPRLGGESAFVSATSVYAVSPSSLFQGPIEIHRNDCPSMFAILEADFE